MAMRPTFNPNAYQVATADQWRNRAVTDPFEPGSTFKAILAAAALEDGVVKPGDRFYGEQGVITIANRTIHDWKKYGWLTFQQVLQNSSNVGSIKVGLQLGRERYYRHITGFGFGSLTGVGLPGESRGQLRAPDRWSGLSLASISIGQEVSVTGVQMLAAFGAIANGGRLMQPHIVRAVLDRRRPGSAADGAPGRASGDLARDGRDAQRHPDVRGGRGDGAQGGRPGLRRRRQDGDGPEGGPGHARLLP